MRLYFSVPSRPRFIISFVRNPSRSQERFHWRIPTNEGSRPRHCRRFESPARGYRAEAAGPVRIRIEPIAQRIQGGLRTRLCAQRHSVPLGRKSVTYSITNAIRKSTPHANPMYATASMVLIAEKTAPAAIPTPKPKTISAAKRAHLLMTIPSVTAGTV